MFKHAQICSNMLLRKSSKLDLFKTCFPLSPPVKFASKKCKFLSDQQKVSDDKQGKLFLTSFEGQSFEINQNHF